MDFTAMAKGLAIVSFGLLGVVLAGSVLWPQQAEQYKKQIINVVVGLVLVGLATVLVGYF